MDDDEVRRQQFLERVAETLSAGRPPIHGRVLGWLLMTDRWATQAEIRTAVQASLGAVSTALRELETLGLVERLARPGQRTGLHRIVAQPWLAALERAITDTRRTAQELAAGRRLFANDPVAQQRLDQLSTYFEVMLEGLPNILAALQAATPQSDTASPTGT